MARERHQRPPAGLAPEPDVGDGGADQRVDLAADEVARGVVKLRDLGQRTEVEVPSAQLSGAVRDFFSGG